MIEEEKTEPEKYTCRCVCFGDVSRKAPKVDSTSFITSTIVDSVRYNTHTRFYFQAYQVIHFEIA